MAEAQSRKHKQRGLSAWIAPSLIQIPARFWDDHSNRCPADDPERDMCVEVSRKGSRVTVECDARQLECLRSDAAFYAEGNVDDSASLVRSAKATLAAIAKEAA